MSDRRIEGRKVYSITHTGLIELESFGHSLSSLDARTQVICHPSKMMHCLELNAVRLSMLRQGIAELWLTDVEVCAENLMADDRYVKDYDAVAVLKAGEKEFNLRDRIREDQQERGPVFGDSPEGLSEEQIGRSNSLRRAGREGTASQLPVNSAARILEFFLLRQQQFVAWGLTLTR